VDKQGSLQLLPSSLDGLPRKAHIKPQQIRKRIVNSIFRSAGIGLQ